MANLSHLIVSTMIKIVFVGDRPSKTNVSRYAAFVGARCFKRLTEWIKIVAPDFYVCYNINQDYHLDIQSLNEIIDLHANGFKVIALGKEAHAALDEGGVPHYELPHPSGRNLQINDPKFIKACLDNAKTYARINQ